MIQMVLLLLPVGAGDGDGAGAGDGAGYYNCTFIFALVFAHDAQVHCTQRCRRCQ